MIIDHPWIFWSMAAALTIYHGMRGAIINIRAVAADRGKASEQDKALARDKTSWPQWQRIYVHYVHGFILNAVGSLAGFGALFPASEMYQHVAQRQNVDSGMAILFAFLVLVAITGITGILPEMLYRGGLFGHKS